MNFSLEISPKTDLDTLPALKDVYITMLPGGDYKDTAEQANKLVKKVEDDFVIFEDNSSLGSFSQFILNTGTVANSFPEDANAVGDCIAPRGLWASTNDAAKLARSI